MSQKKQTPKEFTKRFFEANPHMLDEFCEAPNGFKDVEGIEKIAFWVKKADKEGVNYVTQRNGMERIKIGGWARVIAEWHKRAKKENLTDADHVHFVNARMKVFHEGAVNYKEYIYNKAGLILPAGGVH